MEQNVIFQKLQNGGGNLPKNDPLDPFAKYEHQSQPQQTPGVPQQGQVPAPQPLQQQPPSIPIQPQAPLQQPPAMPPTTPTPPPLPPPPSPSFFMHIPLWAKILAGVGVVIFILFILVAVLSAGKKSSNQPVTLEYWSLWEDKGTMQQVFADFHRKYPYITIDFKKEDPKQYTDRLLARTQNGTGPDIFRYHNSWMPELLSILSPLSTDAITNSEFTKSFYPVAQNDLIKNGAIYGIPLEVDTLSLFVNNNIIKAAGVQAPTTWEAFNSDAATTTVKDQNGKIKTAGAAIGTYDNIIHAPDIIAMLFAQNGANMTNLTSTTKNATNAVDFYTSFAKASGSVWDNTLDPSLVAFAQGNLAMCFGYSYDIFTLRVMNPTLDFSIYPVPHLPNRPITIASYWVEGVSIKSKHQKEAMLLMHYLAQKDTEEKLYALQAKTRPFGEPYARVDLGDTLKNDPMIYPFISQAKTAVSTYFSSNTYDTNLNGKLNVYLGNAVGSILINTSPETAITTLADGVSQVLQQYGQ